MIYMLFVYIGMSILSVWYISNMKLDEEVVITYRSFIFICLFCFAFAIPITSVIFVTYIQELFSGKLQFLDKPMFKRKKK